MTPSQACNAPVWVHPLCVRMVRMNRLIGTTIALILSALLAGSSAALQKGMSVASYWHDQYSYPESDSSLVALTQTGVDWTALLATWYQDSIESTEIYRDTLQTPDDTSLIYMIERCHELGLKVMLKPHVDPQDLSWRALIQFSNEADWKAWFSSYTSFITHYARMAQDLGVEQFCVGCELTGTIHREVDWQLVIDSVKAYYDGPLTYAANWWLAYDSVEFWHALDYAGINGYFELTDSNEPTREDLLSAWQDWLPQVEEFYEKTGKPILITEIGYRSIDGCNINPWDWWSPGEIDLAEQEDCYFAACSTFWSKEWFEGIFFWSWEVDRPGGLDDDGYTPRGKPAEDFMTEWFTRDSLTAVAESPASISTRSRLATYPVPFSQESFVRSGPGHLSVYDCAGRLVRSLTTEGPVCTWDGRDSQGRRLSDGVYLYRIADEVVKTVLVTN